jgi:RNA polymerase sigma factor (sigma-70 family)
MEKSDGELLREYSERRSEEAFRTLAKRHGPIVYGACLRYLLNPELAEDASQAVFLVLAEKASQIRVQTTLVPWCLTAAKNICRRLARSESRRRQHERALTTDIEAENAVADVALFTALDRLRSDEREAIVLRFVQGLSLAEVGQAQGVSEDAARMRVNRGLSRLKHKVVTPVAVPLSLLDRIDRVGDASAAIRALAFARPIYALLVPAGFAAVGISATVAIAAAVVPSRNRPVDHRALAQPSQERGGHQGAIHPVLGVLNKPFTLEYSFVVSKLAPQAEIDANLAQEKKRIDADLDADRISVQEHDRQIVEGIRQANIRRREGTLTLSYDGHALLIDQNMTSPDSNRQATLIRDGQTLELFPGNSTCYWWPKLFMSVPPDIPFVGPSLPYLPTFKGEDLLDIDSGPTYRPGKAVINKDGSAAEFDLSADKKGHYWNRYVLTDDLLIQGQRVARKITHIQETSWRTEYVLTYGRSEGLPQDRFLPDTYLSEDQPIQLNLPGGKYKSLNFSRSRGSADDQIEAKRSQP